MKRQGYDLARKENENTVKATKLLVILKVATKRKIFGWF